MPKRTACRAAWLGLFAAAWVLFPDKLRADDGEPRYTLEEVTSRLAEWESRIQTLRVRAKTVYDPNAPWTPKAHLQGVQRVGNSDWVWTRAGTKSRHHYWSTRNGSPWMRHLEALDGTRRWDVDYNGGALESEPREVRTSGLNPKYPPYILPPSHLRHLWNPFGSRSEAVWIGEAIKRGDLEFVGPNELDGRVCVLVRRVFEAPKGQVTENFWLDPDHSFLPIRVQVSQGEYSVSEFFEPEPGFFFPKRGMYLHQNGGEFDDTETWEVTSVELNQDIPETLWEPPVVKVKEPDLAEKAAAKGRDVRFSVWLFFMSMTGLDFWLSGGFLAVALLLLAGLLFSYFRKRN